MRSLAMVVVLGVASFGLTACEETEARDRAEVIALINKSRTEAGLRPLAEHSTLNRKADGWAKTLRDACRLWHSQLSDGAPPEWRKLGENVGYGGTISIVHGAYLKSPGHRANIMDPSYTHVGAGAVHGECNGQKRVFTVQEFMKA